MTKALHVLTLAALVQLLKTANAFQSTHVAKHVHPAKLWAPKAEQSWSPFSTELIHENAAFTPTAQPTTSTLSALQIRSIFRSSEATEAATATRETSTRGSRASNIVGSLKASPLQLTSKAAQATSRAARKLKGASQTIVTGQWLESLLNFVRQYWWFHPAFLALVPIYTTFVLGIGDAAMPHWWPVTPMGHILKAPDAAMVLSVFLGSNIVFFLGGGYLVQKFPASKPAASTTPSSAVSSSFAGIRRRLENLPLIPTRQTWLGLLLLASGVISTIFHVEQALGSFALANSLCYIDHAVAGTSTFYFFHTCGRPSQRVAILMALGLAALSIVPPHPLPGYAWLHSAWHFIATAAAVIWACESHGENASPMVEAIEANKE